MGVSLQAQNLYVKLVGNNEQVVYSIESKPKITFGSQSMKIETTTTVNSFTISDVQHLLFTHNPVSIIEMECDENNISIYPNPVSEILELTLLTFTPGLKYQIFDMHGKLVKVENIQSTDTKIAVQNLNSGVYILQIDRNGQFIKSFKIIKQ